jgi:hypothetical protein
MNLEAIATELGLECLTPQLTDAAATEIAGGYASDLLSDVLANAPADGVLVTLQVHLNVVAVASHADLAAVIFTSGRTPDDDVVAKAVEEGVALYCASADTFETVGRLFALGIKGRRA